MRETLREQDTSGHDIPDIPDTMAKVCVVVGVGPGTGMICVTKWVAEGFKVAMVSRTETHLCIDPVTVHATSHHTFRYNS